MSLKYRCLLQGSGIFSFVGIDYILLKFIVSNYHTDPFVDLLMYIGRKFQKEDVMMLSDLVNIYKITITDDLVTLDAKMRENVIYDFGNFGDFDLTVCAYSIVISTPHVNHIACADDPLSFHYSLDQEGRKNPRAVASEIGRRLAERFDANLIVIKVEIVIDDQLHMDVYGARELLTS